jgi:DNA mismatch repair ATPase MutS
MGDFFETFGEDAKITSRVLNITLTKRDKTKDATLLADSTQSYRSIPS